MNKFPIEIRKSKIGGRGVFATRDIHQGEIIEVCPVLPLNANEFGSIAETELVSYVYTWPGPRQTARTPQERFTGACVAFGYGSMYNHSKAPNAYWRMSRRNRTLTFVANEFIAQGEEIFHDYNWPASYCKMVGVE